MYVVTKDYQLIWQNWSSQKSSDIEIDIHYYSATISSKNYIEEIEKLLLNFVWNNITANIRSSVLKSKCNMGGANLTDLTLKDKCLKIGWISRLLNQDGSWKDYITKALPLENIEHLLSCNIEYKDLEKNCNINRNSMWIDVLKHWCKFNYKHSISFIQKDTILKS